MKRSKNRSTRSAAEKVRVLIVDDEPIARRGIRSYVKCDPRVAIVGECANGHEAVKAIRAVRPDVVFLDIQMPEMNGLQVIERLDHKHVPLVVFVTAYNQYAVDAFKVHAFDYILKPFDQERITEVLDRVVEQARQKKDDDLGSRLEALLQRFEKGQSGHQMRDTIHRLTLKEGERIFFVNTSQIDWIEASGIYVTLHIGQQKHLLKETMNALESKLDPDEFLRVHRSTIINLRSVKELKSFLRRSFLILMKDNTRLYSSRRYHSRIKMYLKAIH